jgi:hypothetical protein
MGIEILQELLTGLGNASGIEGLQADDSGFCLIEVDGIVCNMQYVYDTNSLYVFAELGEIPAHLLGKLAPELLAANLFGVKTGGGTLALLEESNQLVFSHQTTLENIDAPRFEQILENCINYMVLWKETLGKMIKSKTESEIYDAHLYTHIRG